MRRSAPFAVAAGRAALPLVAALALGACRDGAPGARASASTADLPASPPITLSPAPYRCGSALSRPGEATQREIARSYADWKNRYLTDEGASGFLRVRMPTAEDKSSSEGIAYGMLISVYLRDRATFDALWGYARRYLNENGLMRWEVSASGEATDRSSATDADEDMAFALVAADSRWGGYGDAADGMIRSLMTHAVELPGFVLKPGDSWGGSKVTNPSYFAPAYYRVFAARTGDARWEQVADTSYAIMARVAEKHGRATGLQPDWTTVAGDSAPGGTDPSDDGFEFDYGYNATRVPWRLAMDAAWNCDPRAQGHLERLNAFFARIGPREMRDGYLLNGRAVGEWHTAAFVAPAAAGAILSRDAPYRDAVWKETLRLRHEGYYHDSLRLLALLLASGNMHPPGG
jgi:endo-1,4-beta-D-glucanase Y